VLHIYSTLAVRQTHSFNVKQIEPNLYYVISLFYIAGNGDSGKLTESLAWLPNFGSL
jgi:hypothetical protein